MDIYRHFESRPPGPGTPPEPGTPKIRPPGSRPPGGALKFTARYKKYAKCRVRMAEPSRESHRFGIAGSRLPRSVVHNLLVHRFLCNPKVKIYPIDNKMLWRQSKRVTKSCTQLVFLNFRV